MRRALVCALVLAAASPAAAALPPHGTLVPGRSLGGVRLGETATEVRAALGGRHGSCRACRTPTWYFTYRPFAPEGLAVELTRSRVSAVYTLWRPAAWSAPKGLTLGAAEAQVLSLAGPLVPVACPGYDALTSDAGRARTVYYIFDGSLWGFGLLTAHATPCR